KGKTLLLDEYEEAGDQGDQEEVVYRPETVPSDEDYDEGEDTSLAIVCCAIACPKVNDDWRQTTIFFTYAKCGNEACKVIVDSG
ncbi:hypothetical protein PJI17_32430, partial [Mycobacterium kansasii]